jgi:hypothetical protein
MSLNLALRPTLSAARPVIPDPAKKSATTSPGSVKNSTNGRMAAIGTFVR